MKRILLIALFLAGAPAAAQEDPLTPENLAALRVLPAGIAPLPELSRDDPRLSREVLQLGHELLHDKRLSKNGKFSCATCHDPRTGYALDQPTAPAASGGTLRRNPPSLIGVTGLGTLFWDGRAATPADQLLGPLFGPEEMGGDRAWLEARLAEPDLAAGFERVYGKPPTLELFLATLVSYERSLTPVDSDFDRFLRGQTGALSPEARRGFLVFLGKGRCAECHGGPNLSDGRYHNLGLPTGEHDRGREEVTKDPTDRGAFRTPTLRAASVSPPYFHDGSVKTLEEVVEFFDRGGGPAPEKSPLVVPLGLSPAEKADLVAFLRALKGKHRPHWSFPARAEIDRRAAHPSR